MSEIDNKQLEGAIEALLFVTDEPVSSLVLAEILEKDAGTINDALNNLSQRLEAINSGIQLREIAGGWRLYTHPAYHELVEKYVLSWDTRKLSAAAMETLAIVAYSQPVTRASISEVRGVNSDSTVSSLLEKGLLREVGTSDSAGNPTLYGTSYAFLEKFGLKSIEDLPPLDDFAPDESTRKLIASRLAATRSDSEISNEEASMMAEEMLYGDAPEDGKIDSALNGENVINSKDLSASDLLASALGAVEKIDFENLNFNFDDE